MNTLESILVGIDGSDRGKKALKWAARLANREQAHLTLLAVIDPASDKLAGSDHKVLRDAVENVLGEAQELVRADYPELDVDASYVSGDIVEALVGASESHDMIVMGSHHGATVAERVWSAKGLRVSVSTSVPTVVVPADWDPYNEAKGIVVGVGPQDEVSDKAVELGVHLAKALEEPLELISSWGIPTLLSRSAEFMGGGLAPVGESFQRNLDARVAAIREAEPSLQVEGHSVEAPSPTQALLQRSQDCRVLLLGTHAALLLRFCLRRRDSALQRGPRHCRPSLFVGFTHVAQRAIGELCGTAKVFQTEGGEKRYLLMGNHQQIASNSAYFFRCISKALAG